MFGMSLGEMLMLGALALIIVGPKQLPDLAKYLGRFLNDLKRSTEDITSDLKKQASIDFDWEKRLEQKKNSETQGPVNEALDQDFDKRDLSLRKSIAGDPELDPAKHSEAQAVQLELTDQIAPAPMETHDISSLNKDERTIGKNKST